MIDYNQKCEVCGRYEISHNIKRELEDTEITVKLCNYCFDTYMKGEKNIKAHKWIRIKMNEEEDRWTCICEGCKLRPRITFTREPETIKRVENEFVRVIFGGHRYAICNQCDKKFKIDRPALQENRPRCIDCRIKSLEQEYIIV